MEFVDLLIGNIDLIVQKDDIVRFLNSLYDKWYKKDRLFHVTSDRTDYPHLKITGDTASCKLFFFNDDDKEFRFYLDGSWDIESNKIHFTSITPSEYPEMDPDEYLSVQSCLLKLSSLGQGQGVYISENGFPIRLRGGKVDSSKKLLQNLYDKIPESDREDIEITYKWILLAFDKD